MNNFRKEKYTILETIVEEELESLNVAKDHQNRYYIIQHLKIHKFPDERRDEVRKKLETEVEKICKLSKDNFQYLRYKTYYTDKEDLYIVQEYVQGSTLFNTVKTKSRFSQGNLVKTIAKLLTVLDSLHRQGLVHGKINPDNILIDQNQQPILVNFDFWKEIAKPPQNTLNQLTDSQKVNLRDFYPSQVDTNRTPQADLYALSLTGVYALTGQLPQKLPKAKDTQELMWVQQASKVDSKLVKILSRAIHPSPSYRFATARAMLDALHSHLAIYGKPRFRASKQVRAKKQFSKVLPLSLIVVLVTTLFLGTVFVGLRTFTSDISGDEEEVTIVEPRETEPEPSEVPDPLPEEPESSEAPDPLPEEPEPPEEEDINNQGLINLTLNNQGNVTAQMQSRSVALTFDDGPSPRHTEAILDILKQHRLHATFFVVGSRVEKHCQIVKRIVEEGHELGNHTQNHLFLWDHGREVQMKEIRKTQEAVHECVGQKPHWFRSPYGAENEMTLNITSQLNLNTALWTIDTNDWRQDSTASSIAQEGLKAQGRDVILMHDGTEPNKERANDPEVQAISAPDRQSTVKALEKIIRTLEDRGLRIVSLSEAFQRHQISYLN